MFGKVFKLGGQTWGLTYVNGLFSFNEVRENSESIVETNDSDSLANVATGVAGVRTIRFRTGPQINGYLVKLSDKNVDAAKSYVNVMPEMNKNVWEAQEMQIVKPNAAAVIPTDTGHKTTDASISDLLKQIWESLKKKDGSIDENSIKVPITGDGEYTGLWKDNSIAYQTKLAEELLKYADDTHKFDTGETFKVTLAHYLGRLAQLSAVKMTNARTILIDRAVIKNNVLIGLMYRYTSEDGDAVDTDCPSCYSLEFDE